MKSGFPVEAINPLPEMNACFLSADQLLERIQTADKSNCTDSNGKPMLTILDFRNENFLSPDDLPPQILSACNTVPLQLDDIRNPEVRRKIPMHSMVVTVTETGNRDAFVMRYLSKFGFSNICGLQFGMRGWLKLGYPIADPTEN